jgi:Neuraminidase (sialidase)
VTPPGDVEKNLMNAEVEPFVAVDPTNPKILLGTWTQYLNGSLKGTAVAVSVDGGASWKNKAMPFNRCGGAATDEPGDFENAVDPWVDIGSDGTMYAMSIGINLSGTPDAFGIPGSLNAAGKHNAILVSRSTDQGKTWSKPVTLRSDAKGVVNDKNSLTVSPSNPNYVYAVWTRAQFSIDATSKDVTGSGPVWLARSTDGGANWDAAKEIYRPNSGNAGGNRIVVLSDGTLINVFKSADCDLGAGAGCPGSLRVIRSTDNGESWSLAITVSENYGSFVHPNNDITVRAPAFAAIAVGPDDKIWVAWHDTKFSQTRISSVALSSSSDGGLKWSEPVAINKDTSSHAFMPSITVAKDGTIAVSHYDFRNYAAEPSKMLTNTWLLTSKDGKNWMEAKIREPFDVADAPDSQGKFLGDYQGLVSQGTAFLPFYAQANPDTNNRTDIYAIPITPAPSAVYQARTAPMLSTSQKPALQAYAGLAMPGWTRDRVQQRRQP